MAWCKRPQLRSEQEVGCRAGVCAAGYIRDGSVGFRLLTNSENALNWPTGCTLPVSCQLLAAPGIEAEITGDPALV